MSKEAMKLALEALEGLEALLLSMGLTHLIVYGDAEKAITNLQKELEDQPAQQQEPYGQVTVVRRPGCVDQHWFYRWPEPPYLDNAAECHTIYTSPPAQRKPLTEEEILDANWVGNKAHITACPAPTAEGLIAFARAIEAAHGIKGDA